ncbi:MAG: Holliday junction branch migration protein RuvA [bacterium]
MIAQLTGTVAYIDLKFIILNVNNVGYKVFTTNDELSTLSVGSERAFWIHSTIREDAFDLYGFTKKENHDFFELLITVSGIGPKSALGILSVASVESLREAIVSGETSYITKIGGISKKIAEKITIELRGKVTSDEGEFSKGRGKNDADALDALRALGYSHKEAREALEKVPATIKDPGEKVKAALKNLA